VSLTGKGGAAEPRAAFARRVSRVQQKREELLGVLLLSARRRLRRADPAWAAPRRLLLPPRAAAATLCRLESAKWRSEQLLAARDCARGSVAAGKSRVGGLGRTRPASAALRQVAAAGGGRQLAAKCLQAA
jgi:hypothetical protein